MAQLAGRFAACLRTLLALGDKKRQHLPVVNEPRAFGRFLAHYGSFSGVQNHIALAGEKAAVWRKHAATTGSVLVLKVQQLGLNTCWAALTCRKQPEHLK